MQGRDRVKVGLLIFFLIGLIAELMTGSTAVRTARAFAEGPNPGFTGAPGELTCAVSGCHGGEPNTGPGQLQIIAPASYEPNKSYDITVMHVTSDTTRQRWGFELTVLDQSNNRAGTLQNTNGLTQIIEGGPGGHRQYIEHGFLGTFQGQTLPGSWTFKWVAPATDVGTVTFYAAGNQANNNGAETGDQIYSTHVAVPAADATTGPPTISGAGVSGKKLLVMGQNFGAEAQLFLDGERQKKTFNDEENPTTLIVAKKSGKKVQPGQTVSLQVRNPDGSLSNEFVFMRPL